MQAPIAIQASWNSPFGIDHLSKTIPKYKQKIWEWKQNDWAAVRYYAMDQYDLQYSTTNYTNVISSIMNHCSMQMSSTTNKQSLKWN